MAKRTAPSRQASKRRSPDPPGPGPSVQASIDAFVSNAVSNVRIEEDRAWEHNKLFRIAYENSSSMRGLLSRSKRSTEYSTLQDRIGETVLGSELSKTVGMKRAERLLSWAAVDVLGDIYDEILGVETGAHLKGTRTRQLVTSLNQNDEARLSLLILIDSPKIPVSGVAIPSSDLPIFDFLRGRAHHLGGTLNNESDGLVADLIMRAARLESNSVADQLLFLLWTARPWTVKARMPEMVPICVPTPPLDIDGPFAMQSTAGALVRDDKGQLGVTACFHGTGPEGTNVKVGPHDSSVSLACQLQDTVFVPLPAGVNLPELIGKNGVLRDRPPWIPEQVTFWGRVSGNTTTVITGIDRGLPTLRPGRQLCVQTNPDTEEGDSGTALVNMHGKVVGFAFQRTAWGEPLQFSDWIWSASALDALNLKVAAIAGEG